MRTKTHVKAVAVAFAATERRQQRLAQRPEKTWSRITVAALVAALLMVVLAPTAFAQEPVGSLLFVNRATDAQAFAYIDRYGLFHQTYSLLSNHTYAAPGVSHVVNTANGFLIYHDQTGFAYVERIQHNGYPDLGYNYNSRVGWRDILSIGDYLFFYKGDRSGAIGYITPSDGRFVQTATYLPGSFGYWSHIVATDNFLFFYNRFDGSAAVGYIAVGGSFVTTEYYPPGTLATFDYIVSDGRFLLLYNQQTGASMLGVIEKPGRFTLRGSLTLPAGYNKLVRHDRYLFLYNSNAGGGTIGYIDPYNFERFTITQQSAFSPSWTRIVSTKDELVFYNSVSGQTAVGHIDHSGHFLQTQVLSLPTGWGHVVATAR